MSFCRQSLGQLMTIKGFARMSGMLAGDSGKVI